MKLTILFIFLVGCIGKQIYEKQLEEQRKKITFLEQKRDEQQKDIRHLFVRLSNMKQQLKKQQEQKDEESPPENKQICVVIEKDEICVNFLTNGSSQ